MRRIFILFFVSIMLFTVDLKAQILEKAIQRLSVIKNISYTSTRTTKDFFAEEFSKDTLQAKLSNNIVDGTRSELFEFVTKQNKEVFNGASLLRLDSKEKTYVIRNDSNNSLYIEKSIFGWLKYMQEFNVNKPNHIKTLSDTLLNKIPCHHIKIIAYDTVIRKEHHYTIYDIYLNKSNFLPVRTKNSSRGTLSKGGYEVQGMINYVQEQTYTNYKINDKNFPDLSEFKIPADYQPEKNVSKLPLAKGTDAPAWMLENTGGKLLSNKDLKGKVVLIDFTATSCVACILAVPTMNNLHKKYANTAVEIVSINSWDKKESIIKFAKQHKMNYPVYVDPKKLEEKYNVSSIPTFYIIDKNGKVAASFSGFSDKLEAQLISKIEELNK
ncbi:MAG: TlpA disulfide reductase family protein [Bacteroidota bacterium]